MKSEHYWLDQFFVPGMCKIACNLTLNEFFFWTAVTVNLPFDITILLLVSSIKSN